MPLCLWKLLKKIQVLTLGHLNLKIRTGKWETCSLREDRHLKGSLKKEHTPLFFCLGNNQSSNATMLRTRIGKSCIAGYTTRPQMGMPLSVSILCCEPPHFDTCPHQISAVESNPLPLLFPSPAKVTPVAPSPLCCWQLIHRQIFFDIMILKSKEHIIQSQKWRWAGCNEDDHITG